MLNIKECYDTKHVHKRASTVNSLPCSRFCYCRFRHNPPYYIRLLSLAFFCSSNTPMYPIGSRECKGQAHTATQIPHRSGTRGSHRATIQVLATTSTKQSYSYHPGRHTSTLYSAHFLTPQLSLSIHYILIPLHSPCTVKRLVPCHSSPECAHYSMVT